jgi:hypothetical protein
VFETLLQGTAVGQLCAPNGPEIRYPCREEPTRQPHFVHAGHTTQHAHSDIVIDAFDTYPLVEFFGGDSVDPNLVHSDAAFFAKPKMVPACQSADQVCGAGNYGNGGVPISMLLKGNFALRRWCHYCAWFRTERWRMGLLMHLGMPC